VPHCFLQSCFIDEMNYFNNDDDLFNGTVLTLNWPQMTLFIFLELLSSQNDLCWHNKILFLLSL